MKNLSAKIVLSFLLLLFCNSEVRCQVPQGFNYMAIARNEAGDILPDMDLQVRIAILKTVDPLNIVWEEEHSVKTNSTGLFQLVIGDPLAKNIETGSAKSFAEIDWAVQPLYVRTSVNAKGEFVIMGDAQIMSVPYALVSQNVSGLNKLAVAGTTTDPAEALFEVKNSASQTVFAVYSDGIRMYVGDKTAKGVKGGFAIGSFDSPYKAAGQEYFTLTPYEARINLNDPPVKGIKGGFAIGGYSTGKGLPTEFMNVTPLNYFIGYEAGLGINGGTSNIFIGKESGKGNTTGSDNVFLGFEAGLINNASFNSFIGYQSGKANSTGAYNTFMGYNSGLGNSGGESNVFIGYESGKTNTSGNNNIFIGKNAGLTSNGDDNIFIGLNAGINHSSGHHNLLIGTNAGYYHTTQTYNVMMGTGAGYSLNNTTYGSYNTFVGINAGNKIQSSKENTFLGTNAGAMLEEGNSNTIVGIDAGRGGAWDPGTYHAGNVTTQNTILGCQAGANLDVGSGNVLIGYQAGALLVGTTGAPASNKLYISNSATNTLIGGDFANHRVGINMMPTAHTLEVAGDIWANGSTISAGATTWSDSRFKTDINTIANALEDVCRLRGVTYDWDNSNKATINFPSGRQYGVIAQEVEEVFPELVKTEADGYKSVSYEKMSAILIEAVKEQQKQIELQQSEINELKEAVKKLTENR
jgi:trimeric autotransporter adhesin